MESCKKVNVIGDDEAFTFCVKADSDMTDDEIVLKCTEAGLLSRDEVKGCGIVVEDITCDPIEMWIWKDNVREI